MRYQISLEVLMVFGTTAMSGQSGGRNMPATAAKKMWLKWSFDLFLAGIIFFSSPPKISSLIYSACIVVAIPKEAVEKILPFFLLLKGAKWIISGIIRCCENDDAAFSLITTQTSLIKVTLCRIHTYEASNKEGTPHTHEYFGNNGSLKARILRYRLKRQRQAKL